MGGQRRQDSCLNGLNALPSSADIVLIHDAARPFVRQGLITALIRKAQAKGAAIPGVPVKNTIKRVSGRTLFVDKTLERSLLWEIQTPQAFRKDLILAAYEKSANIDATDDAMLVERLKKRVSIVPGSYDNIKITTPDDLILAEAIAGKKKCA